MAARSSANRRQTKYITYSATPSQISISTSLDLVTELELQYTTPTAFPRQYSHFIMGISLSTAKIVAPISWAYMFLSQQYAIAINDPGMKAVNDRNPGAFNPT